MRFADSGHRAGDLLTTAETGWHVHVSNSDYDREITLYRANDSTLT